MAEIKADLTANVWRVQVGVGDIVSKGQAIAVLESMKMEIPVESTVDGVVEALNVGEGDVVQEGDVLAVVAEVGGF